MKLKNDSIVAAIIDFANMRFGVEASKEQVLNQIKQLSFSEILQVVDSIKNDNSEAFSDIIDLSAVVETGYGTATTRGSNPSNSQRQTQQDNDDRRDTNYALKSYRPGSNQRSVAGSNKVATGNRSAVDPAQQQRDTNSDTAQQSYNMADTNSKEIMRLKQLINKGRA